MTRATLAGAAHVAAALLTLAGALGSCRADPPTGGTAPPDERIANDGGGVERRHIDDTVVAIAATGASVSWPGRVVVGSARAVVAAPLSARIKRLLALPGDVVARGAPVVEVAVPELAQAAATLRGARARRAVNERRRAWLLALRGEGVPRVVDELAAETELAELDSAIATASALMRVVDLDQSDAAIDEIAARGAVILRAPIGGSVVSIGDTTAGVVVGAVVPTGTVLATLAAERSGLERVRIIVRLPVSTSTPPVATALVGGGLPLVALPGQGPVDLADGASDRVFAVQLPGASRDAASLAAAAAALVDGQGLTMTLPLTTTTTSSSSPLEPGSAGAPPPVRVPASAVRLGGDGVAEVAEVKDGAVTGVTVTVLGRVGDDLILSGVVVGARLKRDARAALLRSSAGGEHDH
jgi:hypothetical protein